MEGLSWGGALSFIWGRGSFNAIGAPHSLPQCSARPSIASALTAQPASNCPLARYTLSPHIYSAQHMRSTCTPVLTRRRGGVPGGAVPQCAPPPPAPPGRPESSRLRRSVSPLLGASGSGSCSGVPSPMQRRAQPPLPPRGSSSLPPSRPASSTAGGDQLADYAFAHAHDALDEFKRLRR